MNTSDYLNKIAPKRPFMHPRLPFTESKGYWVHEHRTSVKIAEVAAFVLGIAMVAALPITLPILGGVAVVIAVVGGVIATIAAVAYFVLDKVLSFSHDMGRHVFKPGKCIGGELRYINDVPILDLDAKNPYGAGRAQGYLLGASINTLRKKMGIGLRVVERWPKAKKIPHLIAGIKKKIPEEYLLELKGMVDGFNQWAREQRGRSPAKITIDDLILFNMLPDKYHFSPKKLAQEAQEQPIAQLNVACTVILDRDDEEGITMGRNMDWPSLGVLGTYSLLIRRNYKDFSTVDVAIPGMVGTATGMNSYGFSLAMNVCHKDDYEERGLPAAILNRLLLQKCKKVDEVSSFLGKYVPMGSYHLTVADKEKAQTFHLYQDKTYRNHYIRKFLEKRPLVVTNCLYKWEGAKRIVKDCNHSFKRRKTIDEFWKNAREILNPEKMQKRKLVAYSLSLPYVDNFMTTHRVIMQPELKRMAVAFDNGFAGSRPLHWLTEGQLFAS